MGLGLALWLPPRVDASLQLSSVSARSVEAKMHSEGSSKGGGLQFLSGAIKASQSVLILLPAAHRGSSIHPVLPIMGSRCIKAPGGARR